MKPVINPPNPFLSEHREYFEGMVPPAKTEVFLDNSKSILAHNDSPDLGFRWSLNPYRGCAHACAYCYARPSHEYLDFGAGTDFDTKIVVKPKAPALLRQTFLKASWKGECVMLSGDTDCYQPLEANYQLTRQCLEVCLEFGNPLAIITKSFLVTRDTDLLAALEKRTHCNVTMSIPFLDEKIGRLIEPNAASVAKRFEALEKLAAAGVEVNVNIAPVIPGLNDAQIAGILKKAKACGAQSAFMIMLRLPGSVKEVFSQRILESFPLAHEKIFGRIRQARGGKLYDARFDRRMTGSGEYWQNIEKMFAVQCRKLGLNLPRPRKIRGPFCRPGAQKELF